MLAYLESTLVISHLVVHLPHPLIQFCQFKGQTVVLQLSRNTVPSGKVVLWCSRLFLSFMIMIVMIWCCPENLLSHLILRRINHLASRLCLWGGEHLKTSAKRGDYRWPNPISARHFIIILLEVKIGSKSINLRVSLAAYYRLGVIRFDWLQYSSQGRRCRCSLLLLIVVINLSLLTAGIVVAEDWIVLWQPYRQSLRVLKCLLLIITLTELAHVQEFSSLLTRCCRCGRFCAAQDGASLLEGQFVLIALEWGGRHRWWKVPPCCRAFATRFLVLFAWFGDWH